MTSGKNGKGSGGGENQHTGCTSQTRRTRIRTLLTPSEIHSNIETKLGASIFGKTNSNRKYNRVCNMPFTTMINNWLFLMETPFKIIIESIRGR